VWGLGLRSLGVLIWFADVSVWLGVVFEEAQRRWGVAGRGGAEKEREWLGCMIE